MRKGFLPSNLTTGIDICSGTSYRTAGEWSNGRSIKVPSTPNQRAAMDQASRDVRVVDGRRVPCEDGGRYQNRSACSGDYSRLNRDPAEHYFRKHVGDLHLCCRIDGLRLCFGEQHRNAALFFSGHIRRRVPERALDLYGCFHLQHRRAYRLKEWLLR